MPIFLRLGEIPFLWERECEKCRLLKVLIFHSIHIISKPGRVGTLTLLATHSACAVSKRYQSNTSVPLSIRNEEVAVHLIGRDSPELSMKGRLETRALCSLTGKCRASITPTPWDRISRRYARPSLEVLTLLPDRKLSVVLIPFALHVFTNVHSPGMA